MVHGLAHALLASEPLLGPRLWGPFCSIENLEARLQIPYRILNAEHGRGAGAFRRLRRTEGGSHSG